MSDKCGYCKEHKPTNHLVLNDGNLWIEFCEECGKKHFLKNTDDKEFSIQEIFDNSNNKINK